MKKLILILTGLIFVIFFFWKNLSIPAVNINPNVGTNDLSDLNYPFRHFLSQSIGKGEFPLWSKDISGGFPILAEGQIAGLFPMYLLLAKLPLMESVNYTLITTYFLIFLFSFLYLGKIGFKEEASFFASIVITFGGFSISQLFHWTMLNAFFLFLAQLYFLQLYFEKKRFYWIVLMGISLGLSFLGGHPQIIFYTMLFILPYWAYFWFVEEGKLEITIRKVIIYIVGILTLLIIGLGIGAGQLMPTAEFTLNSTRAAGLNIESAQRFSFDFKDVVSLVSPFYPYKEDVSRDAFVNNGWPLDEKYLYFGIVGLIVLLLAVIKYFRDFGENRHLKVFALYFLFFLIFSFGVKLILGRVFLLPPFSFFRMPFRMMFLANLSIGVFIAYFINGFFEKKRDTMGKIYSYLVLFFFVFLLFFDLRYFAEKLHPPADADSFYKTPATSEFIKDKLTGYERVTNQAYYYPSIKLYLLQNELWKEHGTISNLRNLLPVFNNLLYDIPKNVGAANSAGLKIPWYNDLEQEIYFGGIDYSDPDILTVTDSFVFLNRLMGTKYFVTAMPVKNELLGGAFETEFESDQDNVRVYEFLDYFPRLFMVPTSEKYEAEEIRKKVVNGDFNPKNVVLLEEDTDWGSKGGFASAVEMVEYEDQKVVIKTQASGDGFLFLSDTYYPGWKVYVDGSRADIFKANYAFRAVPVPAGEHEVVFSYEPDSFYWGIRVTILSSLGSTFIFLFLLGFGVLKDRRKVKKPKGKKE